MPGPASFDAHLKNLIVASHTRLPFGAQRSTIFTEKDQSPTPTPIYLAAAQQNDMSKKKKDKKAKKTALVICQSGRSFWTTQQQFWLWARERVVVKTGDNPLTGVFAREHEETFVVLSNTVLNLAHPNHLREALAARRMGFMKRVA